MNRYASCRRALAVLKSAIGAVALIGAPFSVAFAVPPPPPSAAAQEATVAMRKLDWIKGYWEGVATVDVTPSASLKQKAFVEAFSLPTSPETIEVIEGIYGSNGLPILKDVNSLAFSSRLHAIVAVRLSDGEVSVVPTTSVATYSVEWGVQSSPGDPSVSSEVGARHIRIAMKGDKLSLQQLYHMHSGAIVLRRESILIRVPTMSKSMDDFLFTG